MDQFTHPHPLEKLLIDSTFKCILCDTVGSGSRIRCSTCNFDLHEDCAKYLLHRNDVGHPKHQLILAKCIKTQTLSCDVCNELIDVGQIYTCPTCDFYDLHTHCATSSISSATSSNSTNEDVLNDEYKHKWRKRIFCLNAAVTVVNVMGAIAGLPLEIPKMKSRD